jgi:type III secretion protein Q
MNRFSSADSAEDMDLASVKVRVVFELGRMELSVGEVSQLAPGMVVSLTRPVEEALDIVVNGKRIGVGTLVQVGDSIGVRVVRLNKDG